MSFTIFAVLVGAVAAGFVSGLSGFAFAMVSISIWAWVLAPKLIAPLVVAGALTAQLVSLGSLRMRVDWRQLLPFLIGGVVGVPLGIALLTVIDLHIFRVITGAALIIYCAGMLLLASLPAIQWGGRVADGVSGLAGGVMGGLAGLTGPVPTLWCSLRGWDKDTQRAIFQSFNLVMQVITLMGYAWAGQMNAEFGRLCLLVLPAVLVPAWIGTKLYTRLSDQSFRRIILGLLLVSGVLLVSSGL